MAAKKHTIILVQPTASEQTRTYFDFETVTQACDGVCRLFENRLKQLHANQRNITYDVSDLFKYIDGLTDMGALVFDSKSGQYTPRNKDWIKQRVLNHLKQLANQ